MTKLLRFMLLCYTLSFSLVLSDDMRRSNIDEIQCLATVMYREARGESSKGQLYVASVVINRSILRDKPICKIMEEPKQFSWYAKYPYVLKLSVVDKQTAIVYDLYMRHVENAKLHAGGVTHFAHKTVRNNWTRKFVYTNTIGGHRFYKEK